MTLITSKEYDDLIQNLTTEDIPEIVDEFRKPLTDAEAEHLLKAVNEIISDSYLRPCERTYNFQGMTFSPDYINELASRNGLIWLLKERKQVHNLIFTSDEIYQLIDAVCDNWDRYHEST